MPTSTEWQVAHEAAERYENILVPAILGPFARALVDWADLQPGQSVIDVGCGTGAAARHAAARVGPIGRVIGIDVNAGMIAVARSIPPAPEAAPLEWRENSAYQLFLPNAAVDAALCAQTLQFLSQRLQALVEMRRVLKPGGHVFISLWRPIEENPYFRALVEAMTRHVGPETAAGLKAAFSLTGDGEIRALLAEAGFPDLVMSVAKRDLILPKLAGFIPRHISATPMSAGYAAASLTAQQAVVQEVVSQLTSCKTSQGAQIPFRSHLIMGVNQ